MKRDGEDKVQLNPKHHDGQGEFQFSPRTTCAGEYQVQHSPQHHVDHLHAEEGGDRVQHNTEHQEENPKKPKIIYLQEKNP